jgi:hypothetical protein
MLPTALGREGGLQCEVEVPRFGEAPSSGWIVGADEIADRPRQHATADRGVRVEHLRVNPVGPERAQLRVEHDHAVEIGERERRAEEFGHEDGVAGRDRPDDVGALGDGCEATVNILA